ncbi:MAG: calcium/sodium antiporter [Desulfobacterales bacterium]|nr:calcium/sodium antiporter [Desulfobacterales bacterium]
MFTSILILLAGLALLYYGSSVLVEGSASTAVMFAVRPVIVGLTVVSFATSAPELLVSLVAAVKGSEGISLGNILGSNVINIALVLGASALIKPVTISKQIIHVELPYMILISFIFWILCLDNNINRLDGIILIVLLIAFLVYGFLTANDKSTNRTTDENRTFAVILKNFVYIVLGIVMLAFGANFVVREAIKMAQVIGLSQTFIGISVVALGTSLPELATSVVAAARGESDISVGNVVGSNLFNICLVMGVVGLFNPMEVAPSLHWFEFPFMLFICLVLGGIAYAARGVGKKGGLLFIALFFVYIGVSYFN